MHTLKYVTEDLLAEGIDVRISTYGQSMLPLIKTGERIIIAAEKKIGVGDIIVYKTVNAMVCHRIIRTYEDDGVRYFQARGDSFFRMDEPVTAAQILGKVIRIERDNVTISRRIFLLIYPILNRGRLNAVIINMLMRFGAIFHSGKKLF